MSPVPILDHFHLQGHRGARGLKPENTLPSFEVALDVGVSSVETDVHLTADDVPVLAHDPVVSERLFRLLPGSLSPAPAARPLLRGLTLAQLRGCRADVNPDSRSFPEQDAGVTPLARHLAGQTGIDPYTPPTLAELFAFVEAYAGDPGKQAGKTDDQRRRAGKVVFDLELKRTPFRPDWVGGGFLGNGPGLLELRVLECVRAAGVIERTTVRSFDHRSVRVLLDQEPTLTGAVLVAGTAPLDPARLAREAGAAVYCPEYEFLDLAQVEALHREGVAVLPWTVNAPADWDRLLAWRVDGITTDFPDRLATFLRARGVAWS